MALFSDSKYATANFRCHGNRGSSETIKFHLGLYTVINWPNPKTPCLVQESGAKLANLYIQAELQPILCSNNNILPTRVGLR